MPSSVKRIYHKKLASDTVFWYSSKTKKFPKLHLSLNCDGLESVDPDFLVSVSIPSVWDISSFTGRPCRMCALESVLYTALSSKNEKDLVFATFTSQASPISPDAVLRNYNWSAHTESGEKRIKRIAKRCSLLTSSSSCGQFAAGMIPAKSVELLSSNLRTNVQPSLQKLPDLSVLECVWSLLGDNPPELQTALQKTTIPDPWEVAFLLTK